MLGLRQCLPDESSRCIDEAFEDEIEFRIDAEWLAHGHDSFFLSCLTYSSNLPSRASHNRRRALSQSSAILKCSGAISYVRTRPHLRDFTSRLRSSTDRCCTNEGSFMSNCAASSLTVAGPPTSCSSTLRRVMLDKAWKTPSTTADWFIAIRAPDWRTLSGNRSLARPHT